MIIKKPIKILKKLIGSVRFYKLEIKKTKPKPKKSKKNRAKPEKN